MSTSLAAKASAFLRKQLGGRESDPRPAQIQQLRGKLREVPRLAITRSNSEPEVIATVCEAARRALGQDLFDEQILGALALCDGQIAEMQTGEGKTLAAVPAACVSALRDGRVHVLTANDYLARRDAAWMGPIYEMLGLRAGVITSATPARERRAAYECDVLYATANEIGFDYLRDHLAVDPEALVQTPFASAIIDEADSLLIDEARVPLVIAGGEAVPDDLARAMAALVTRLDAQRDFFVGDHGRNVQLTPHGVAIVEHAFRRDNLYELDNLPILTAAQDALHARVLLRRDVDYVVKGGAIQLVDEFKGRIARDRRWPAGLQTALEAKEGLPLRRQGRILASITLQHLFGLYPRLAGMTGTAATQAQEFREIYKLEVMVIPTHKPVIRVDEPDVIFRTKAAKESAVAAAIADTHRTGRPVLAGTASVEESERLSRRMSAEGIPHVVLNARNDEAEAAIVARAGEFGAVTISTNMAGRGADIPLGGDRVREMGGLLVLGTNRHESRRIDHQLRGRAGRQGDPGGSRFYVSVQDDLLVRYGIREIDLPPNFAVDKVQQIVEDQNLQARRTLWKYESVLEGQRQHVHQWRRGILLGQSGLDPVEARLTLAVIDDFWSDYLAEVADLRAGIHWVAWGGKDPLNAFVHEVAERFAGFEDAVRAEVAERLAAGRVDPNDMDSFDRSATWTYLVTDNPFGTLTERMVAGVRRTLRDAGLLRA